MTEQRIVVWNVGDRIRKVAGQARENVRDDEYIYMSNVDPSINQWDDDRTSARRRRVWSRVSGGASGWPAWRPQRDSGVTALQSATRVSRDIVARYRNADAQ